MRMLVWIFQSGEPVHTDTENFRSMRAINLCNELIAQGHDVELWTSNFNHVNKSHRYSKTTTIKVNEKLKIHFINSPGYKSNVSFRRLVDHFVLALNLKKLIRQEASTPDVAFVGLPPLETAFVMSKFLTKRNIPFLVDVKDLWPEVFYRELPTRFRFILRFVFLPFEYLLQRTLKLATGISSISDEFLEWCLQKAGRSRNSNDIVAFLNSPPTSKESESGVVGESKWLSDIHSIKGVKIVSFVGTFSEVFDFNPIIKASQRDGFKFVIAGDGPQFDYVLEASLKNTNLVVPGRIGVEEISKLLTLTDYYIIPLKDLIDFRLSLPNKFFDALSAGLPIITSCEGTLRRVIANEAIGYHYSNLDQNDLSHVLEKLRNEDTYAMRTRALALSQEKFSFKRNYDLLVQKLEGLQNGR